MAYTVTALLNTSVDDCKITLAGVTDMTLLRNLEIACAKLGHKTRIKHVEQRVRSLEKAAGIPAACPHCGKTNAYWDEIWCDEKLILFLVCRGCECEGPTGADHATALAGWNKRANEGKWILCTQEMPDSDQTVMTYAPDSDEPIWPAYHDGEQWMDLMGAPIDDAKITHWMQFPEPPQH